MLTIHAGTGADTISNDESSIPWYSNHSTITKVVVSENVTAPANISNLFASMANLTSADLSGLDTSNVTNASNVFANCSQLSEINIGLKTFAKNIFTGLTGKGFMSQDGNYGPYSPYNCATHITNANAGWFNVIDAKFWGSCIWEITDDVLTIHEGTCGPTDAPWSAFKESIKEVVISEKVVAAASSSYMFRGMTNLTKIDLSGLDTSKVIDKDDMFSGCTNLTEMKVGPKTFAVDIFTGISGKKFVPQNGTGGPYSINELKTIAASSSEGSWYNIVNRWGTCAWEVTDGVLTIHAGTGENLGYTNDDYIPWYNELQSIKEVVISENVIAPEDFSYMFGEMRFLASADLSGLDTSNVVANDYVFLDCLNLTKIKIGPKTFAQNIFTGITGKVFTPEEDKSQYYTADKLSSVTAGKTASWYTIENRWGTCAWEVADGTLTIHEGTGADIGFNSAYLIPWYGHRNSIQKVVIKEKVIAPETIGCMFFGLTNLISADLSGLDTSKTSNDIHSKGSVFVDCPKLTTINIGPNTLAANILTGLDGKQLISQDNGSPLAPNNTGWYNVVDAD